MKVYINNFNLQIFVHNRGLGTVSTRIRGLFTYKPATEKEINRALSKRHITLLGNFN